MCPPLMMLLKSSHSQIAIVNDSCRTFRADPDPVLVYTEFWEMDFVGLKEKLDVTLFGLIFAFCFGFCLFLSG